MAESVAHIATRMTKLLPHSSRPELMSIASSIFTASRGRQKELDYVLAQMGQTHWTRIARATQRPPLPMTWTTWLMLGGRGAGKTRAGAEWIRLLAQSGEARRIALVGESHESVRSVMIEGISGLLAIAPDHQRPTWQPSRRRLVWPSGALAECFSAEDPDGLRGYQFDTAWSDELASWRYVEDTWSNLQFGLRLTRASGDGPSQVVTTTPRPIKLLKTLMRQKQTAVTRMSTWDNQANLAEAFLSEVTAQYQGTHLGRQELEGELVEEMPGALWQRSSIDAGRLEQAPPLRRVVIAVDPPASAGATADECGIIVAGVSGLGEGQRGYVLADLSARRLSPMDWAHRVVSAMQEYDAARIVVEANQGGDMAIAVLRQYSQGLPVQAVFAGRSKRARAEPVSMLYQRGIVHHVGTFPALEEQMVTFTGEGGRSPDRLDALVWALSELMVKARPEPRVTAL